MMPKNHHSMPLSAATMTRQAGPKLFEMQCSAKNNRSATSTTANFVNKITFATTVSRGFTSTKTKTSIKTAKTIAVSAKLLMHARSARIKQISCLAGFVINAKDLQRIMIKLKYK